MLDEEQLNGLYRYATALSQQRHNRRWAADSYEEAAHYDISPIDPQSLCIDSDTLQRVWTCLSLQERDVLYHWAVLEPPARHSHSRSRLHGIPAAAAVALALLVLLWQPWQAAQPIPPDIIAAEVIENHLKLKPLDAPTASMPELLGFFTQLDFRPVSSNQLHSRFAMPESSLLGGRYCSIQGVTAAQLRYARGPGVSTLYEVPFDPARYGNIPSADRGEAPLHLLQQGLNVHLWVESGLLMALVAEAHDDA